MRTAAVIGAGLAGLTAAIRLAKNGWRVRVFEEQSFTGGKASSESFAGYRFDAGPSLLTMPEVFDELFAFCGERRSDHLGFIPLAPICRYFFSDETRLSAYSDIGQFGEEVSGKTGDSVRSLRKFLSYAKTIHKYTAELFLHKSLHELSTYLHPAAWKSLLNLPRIDALRTMDRANNSFFRDPRMVQLFDRYATYNGSSPFKVPATLNIIPWVEYGRGGFAVAGGIRAIPDALTALAERNGVEFSLNTRVERIIHDDRRLYGVHAGGKDLAFDIVVSNADVLRTYEDLLDDPEAPSARRYRSLEPSSSGLVFLWGMSAEFPELSTNNIFFSPDYAREFADLFDRRVCPSDPTVYINITSKTTPTDAPTGCENWFVLVNAPPDEHQDWSSETDRIRNAVVSRIERGLGRPMADRIVAERVLTPADLARKTGSRKGSLYGISSNTPAAAFLRHPNRSRRYKGLYFCGGSAHPGGGMPLALLSGQIVADLVRRHERDGT